jgi:hypothetical protein
MVLWIFELGTWGLSTPQEEEGSLERGVGRSDRPETINPGSWSVSGHEGRLDRGFSRKNPIFSGVSAQKPPVRLLLF